MKCDSRAMQIYEKYTKEKELIKLERLILRKRLRNAEKEFESAMDNLNQLNLFDEDNTQGSNTNEYQLQ